MQKLIGFLVVGTLLFSCKNTHKINPQDLELEKNEIEKVIKNTIAWAKNKDTTLLYNIIANDENYIEVHPGNTMTKGISKFREAERFWLDSRFKHVKFETWDMHINLSQDATVA